MAFTTVNSADNKRAYPVLSQPVNAQPAQPAISPIIDQAFGGDWTLRQRVYEAIGFTPQYGPLFEDVARYVVDTTTRIQNQVATAHRQPPPAEEEPAIKKRKLQNGNGVGAQAIKSEVASDAPVKFKMQDISFTIPQRKKLSLEITAAGGQLRARNQTTDTVEFGVAMNDIEHILCLPVPEKNQRQFNFCVIPKYGDGITLPPADVTVPESIQWTVNDGPPKTAFYSNGQQISPDSERTAEDLIRNTLNEAITHTKVIRPDDREFVSAMPEAHRKNEKAYHVKAFRGSKEGYLFFLSTGIFFGFKKPLLFFGFETIESISYTSVLQRTFNLNISARSSAEDEEQEIEFSMIDQSDFPGIDAYVKKHGLQDASLAEARRAKKLNLNGEKRREDATGEEGDADEETELQKAQRELEDQEDEEEEDYDPGSEADSDGSGSSSEEEDDAEDAEDAEEGDEDLVKGELGSEAEEVSGEEL